MEQIHIPLKPKSRSYDVRIGQGALAASLHQIKTLCPRKVVPVISDETVADLHLDTLKTALQSIGLEPRILILPPGEATKSFGQLERVCNFLLEQNMERSDCLIAFGGGVIGDLAGLASALLKRGTGFIQLPTTLLAQVDSSVGGKTAINTRFGKNMIGVFHQPKLVVADLDFLTTLNPREWRAGYAEMLKMAVLSDRDFFDILAQQGPALREGNPKTLAKFIARSVAGKAKIVAQDEREHGVRALLNLGHSFAHALEAEGPGRIVHGEAVAAGIGAAVCLSSQLGFCPDSERDQIVAHLQEMGLPASLSQAPGGPYEADNLLARIRQDKKNSHGVIHLVLLQKIGAAFVCKDVSEQTLLHFMESQFT